MRIVSILLVMLLASACADEGEPWTGMPIADMRLDLYSTNVGVYPDQSVLADPNNPFANSAIGEETIWTIQGRGGIVAAFYAWATACARGCTGERQYYAALDLKAIYEMSMVADPLELERVRELAIAGFQAVLDYFPTSVTYDATGTRASDLATPCVLSILEMGGKVEGGWVIVQTENGGKLAVRP